MARDDHLQHLSEVPLFSALTKKDLRTIAKASTETNFEAGRVLIDQGGAGREAFVILEGKAAVKRSNRKIASLGPGDCVGELALLDRGPRTATVVTETPVRALVLGNREFGAVLDDVPGLSHKLLAALASRVRELDSKVFG